MMADTVRIVEHDGVLVASLHGHVDIANIDSVSAKILARLRPTPPGLVVDLTDTTYLDSKGIRLLVDLQERLDSHRLRLVCPGTSPIRRLFDIVRLPLPVNETVDDALQALNIK